MTAKTIAMKLLEQRNVPYEVRNYPSGERDAEQIALHFGVPPEQVYKTLVVVRPKGKPLLVMLAANRQLDLKKLAKMVGEKKVAMATHREAEQLTRLQVGGISPLALLNRGFMMLADFAMLDQEHVFVSAGRRGTNLLVPVASLLELTAAELADVTDL